MDHTLSEEELLSALYEFDDMAYELGIQVQLYYDNKSKNDGKDKDNNQLLDLYLKALTTIKNAYSMIDSCWRS